MYLNSCCLMLWRTFVSLFDIARAQIRFSRFKKPIVTIFGSHLITHGNKELIDAVHEISFELVKSGHMIMTGAGGGIMHHAHRGACAATVDEQPESIGISVKGIDESSIKQDCKDALYLSTHTFAARKWILMSFSEVFLFFPGSFGTLDEFMEILMYLRLNQLEKRKIVLYKKSYWQGFLQWAEDEVIASGYADKVDLSCLILVDSVPEALEQLKECCTK